MSWIVTVLLGGMLLLMCLADVAWGNQVSWFRLALGVALVGLGIGQRIQSRRPF
ncbi:MAG: hypothetical protein PVF70_13280 [Anaerolineales bacterium]|jgi:hypothetical protein